MKPGTPLPWKLKTAVDIVGSDGFVVLRAGIDGHDPEEYEQNARYGNHACNLYQELLEACEKAYEALSYNETFDNLAALIDEASEILDAAITKAEEAGNED